MNTKFLIHTATILLTSVIFSGLASAQQMNYQGRLTDASGNALADGSYDLRFQVYTTNAGGSPIWGPSDVTATLVNGRFNVILGEDDDVTPTARKLKDAFTTGTPRYLGITLIDAVTNPGNDEISPRQQILSSPNAMFSNHATTADTAANFTSAVLKTDETNARVGVGTSSPTAKLHVSEGRLKVSQSTGAVIELSNNTRSNNIFTDANGDLYLRTDSASHDVLLQAPGTQGNVGIGTTTPTEKLDVGGNATVSGRLGIGTGPGTTNVLRLNRTIGSNDASGQQHNLQLEIRNGIGNRSLGIGVLDNGIGVIQAKDQGTGGENLAEGGYQKLLLNPVAGSVGIGTVNPTKAKLEIGGSITSGVPNGGFLGSGGSGTYSTNPRSSSLSIYCSNEIAGSTYLAFSDERIKHVIGRSDGAEDLATLDRLEVVDYTFKDTIAKGDQAQKKVLAQQVDNVYPQAVTKHTDVVPDIYQRATITEHWIQLATDLQPGERVRLVGENSQGVHEVLEVRQGAFRTDFAADGNEVFVYGREVNDFHLVDYEAIAMLNVSATQELHRRLKAQETELASKTAEIAALKERLAGFDEKFAKLERLLEGGSSAKLISFQK